MAKIDTTMTPTITMIMISDCIDESDAFWFEDGSEDSVVFGDVVVNSVGTVSEGVSDGGMEEESAVCSKE